jgi:hypothetical protein
MYKPPSCHLTTLQGTVLTVKGLNKPSLLEQSAQENIARPTLGRDVTFKIILPPTSGLQVASFNDAFDGISSMHFCTSRENGG